LVLPEFQREWTKEQAKQLMVSLAKGHPVGGLLLWKTDASPELKNVDALPDESALFRCCLTANNGSRPYICY